MWHKKSLNLNHHSKHWHYVLLYCYDGYEKDEDDDDDNDDYDDDDNQDKLRLVKLELLTSFCFS